MVSMLNAYQKIGTDVAGLTPREAMGKAGLLDWNQRLVNPTLMDGGGIVDAGRHRFNVADVPVGVSPDGTLVREPRVLGAVLDSYKPFQLEDQFLPLLDGMGAGGLAVSVMGAYDQGRAAYAYFDMPAQNLGGESIGGGVVLATRLDGGGAAKAFMARERTWCANMLAAIARKERPVLSVRHTRNADPRIMEQVEVLLKLTTDWDRALAREIGALQSKRVTRRQYVDTVVPALLGDRPGERGRSQTIFDRKFAELVAAWSSPVAVEGESAWRAYSAVSEWEQHHRSPNGVRLAEAVLADRQPFAGAVLGVLQAV